MEYPTYIYQVPGQYSLEGTKTRVINASDKTAYCCFEGTVYLGSAYYRVEFIIREPGEHNTLALTHPSPFSQRISKH